MTSTTLHPRPRSVNWETAMLQAERVAQDLVRHAAALFGYAFEVTHTDPDPEIVRAAAGALEAHARTLRGLDAPQGSGP